jgi:hypothetical protein
MTTRRLALSIALVLAAASGVAYGLGLANDDETRQEEVARRGADVMPFSLDATTHVFDASKTGGRQHVTVDDPSDDEQIDLIRGHLKEEATAFARGDFGDPATIHGDEMPGLAELRAGHERINVRYGDLPGGAQITYSTSDPALARAIAAWFQAQLSDHGDDATHSEHPDESG